MKSFGVVSSKAVRTIRLSIRIVRVDFRRRYALTRLGMLWFVMPIATTLAVSGIPASVNGGGMSIVDLASIAFAVCASQLVIGSASETARLARRNRRLITHLGPKAIVMNLSGLMLAQLLFLIQVTLISITYTIAGVPNVTMANGVISLMMLFVPLSLLGLALSLIVSFLSVAIIDIRYSFQFLPLLIVLVVPQSAAPKDSNNLSVLQVVNPFWSLVESVTQIGHNSLVLWMPVVLNSCVLILLISVLKRLQTIFFAVIFSRSI